MSIDDEEVDLGLALGSRNHCIQTRSNTSPGAGVNANSRVDMAFAASDPLSELVWSPHNGLSLKCADSSSGEKKPLLLWNVGPTSKGFSTSATIGSKGSEDENLTMVNADAEFGDKFSMVRSSRSSQNPDLGTSHGHPNGISEEEVGTSEARKEENRENNGEENLSGSRNVQLADVAEKSQKNAGKDILVDETGYCEVDMQLNESIMSEINAAASDTKGSAVPFHYEPQNSKIAEALFSSPPNSPPQQKQYNEPMSETGDLPENNARTPLPAPPLTKLEASAENDLGFLNAKEGEMRIAIPIENSPTNSQMRSYREKGKEKALSDGGIATRLSDDEDESHESVESCNAGLFSKGIKRKNYNNELNVGSKRMKTQNEGTHGSTSFVGPDSSFMNWISNMVKGLADSHRQESSSQALTLARHETSSLNKDSSTMNTGFQTVFKSLYCQNKSLSSTGLTKTNHSIGDSKELVVADKTLVTANSCERNNDESCKQIIVSQKEENQQISAGPVPVQLYRPWIFSAYTCKSGLQGNKALEKPLCDGAKVGSSDSLCKQVNSIAGDTGLNIPLSASRPEKGNPSASLWITRLYTRTPCLENQISREPWTECPKENLGCQTNDVVSVNEKSSEARDEEQIYASKNESCGVFVKAESSFDLNFTSKVNPIMPSPKRRSSEAMASVFARRLDALRHIMPSDRANSSSCVSACLFCGRGGHDIRDCTEVTETELENFLVKLSSFDRMDSESQSMCIRCFQLDHWAISCPFASSSSYQFCAGKENYSRHAVSQEEDHKLVSAGREEPCLGSFPSYLPWNVKWSSSKKLSASIDVQKSSFSNMDLKDSSNFPLCNFIAEQNTVAPVEMFHAIKKLRLSRADILRWMNSNVPLSHLNGFFLRLRLGKSEPGLGGTGYYAACIAGDAGENIGPRSQKSISVDVGGIKSSVGSQYISNHDFLEEEIKAWWCRIVKTGGKIPSLDELNSKFDDRRNLSF